MDNSKVATSSVTIETMAAAMTPARTDGFAAPIVSSRSSAMPPDCITDAFNPPLSTKRAESACSIGFPRFEPIAR